MSNLGDYAIAEFSRMEIARGESFMKQLDPARVDAKDYYGLQVVGKHFGEEFEGAKIKKCHFTQCQFIDVSFVGTSGGSSSFKECFLRNCRIENACFDISDFSNTHLSCDQLSTSISASSFSYSNFSESRLSRISCRGCNFENTFFKKTTIEKSEWHHCSFENARFENTEFLDSDLSNTSIDYSWFKNASFNNVRLPLVGLLHTFDGLINVEKYADNITFYFPSSNTDLSFSDLVERLDDVQAYFFSINDFFILTSLNIYLGNHELAYSYLEMGLRYSLSYKDFRMIGYYCKLASINHFFTKEQLRQLYANLRSTSLISSMSGHEYQIFLLEMDRIKRLLIDGPFGLPQMKILITTDINISDATLTAEMLSYLNESIEAHASQSSNHVSLRHNSPLSFELFLSDSLLSLYGFALMLSTGLLGLTKIIAKIQNVIYDQHKIEGIKLENKLKELDLEKKRRELGTEIIDGLPIQTNETIVLPSPQVASSVVSISLSFQTDFDLPKELREVEITHNNR